jgi:hypothetical protein
MFIFARLSYAVLLHCAWCRWLIPIGIFACAISCSRLTQTLPSACARQSIYPYTVVPAFFQRSRSICVSVSFQFIVHFGFRFEFHWLESNRSNRFSMRTQMDHKLERKSNENWNETEIQM